MGKGSWCGRFVLLASLLVLVGCDQQAVIEKFASPEDRAAMQAYVQDIQMGRYQAVIADLDPQVDQAEMRAALPQIAAMIPDSKPLSVKLVGAISGNQSGDRKSSLTYEYQYPDRWLVLSMVLDRKSDKLTILGIHASTNKQSLEETYAFRLSGQPISHLLMLTCLILAPLFTIFALLVCVRTPGVKRKWLWIIFILFGVGSVKLNWTTGEWGLYPVTVQLFSAGFFKPFYGPLTLACSVPLGAVWFLLARKKLSKPSQPGPSITA